MIVIGAGRVGTSLAKRSAAHGVDITVLGRSDSRAPIEDGPQGDPIVVATRNDDLLEVIDGIPHHRKDDLVFVQNGLIRGLLRNNALMNTSRGLIYFAATARDGEIDPGTTSWFTGPHGLTMARWFSGMKLKAQSVDWARFAYYEFEKLTWLCALGVACDAFRCTVGEVLEHHRGDLEVLVTEMAQFGRIALNVDPPADYLLSRIVEYSESIPAFRAAVKEFEWRNGPVLDAMAQHGKTQPRMIALLREGGHTGLLRPAHQELA